MCGILGWAGPEEHKLDAGLFRRALDVISHRGPDDWGIESFSGALLGHRRLSIIDLSPAGHQPMFSKSGRQCVVFNGEIYNYLELRSTLLVNGQRLQGGDTELLVELIERDGPSALNMFNGMWAFASWDRDTHRLLLSRDRFGVKPLYYHVDERGIVFSSEPKAILLLRPELRRVDPDVLADFLIENKLHASERSFYHGLKCLLPGTWLTYDARANKYNSGKYWSYPDLTLNTSSESELCEEFDRLFDDSVRMRLRSDVPLGITLSGGLDSSAILASSSKFGVTLNAFTSTYNERGVDEMQWAKLVANRFGNALVPVVARYEDWLDSLSKIAWHMDSPGYSPAVYPLWSLMRSIKQQGVKVILEGQGADEALGGYPQYAAMLLSMQLKSFSLADKLTAGKTFNALRGSVGTTWTLAWTLREAAPIAHRFHRKRTGLASILCEDVRRRVLDRTGKRVDEFRSLNDRLQFDHSNQILPGLLHYGDAMSMAHGIEARNPFLDYRLVDFMFRAPEDVKIRAGLTKWILRRYLRENRLSEIASRRDKRGYPTPIADWLSRMNMSAMLEDLISTRNPLSSILDPKGVKALVKAWDKPTFGADHHLYKIVSTYSWAKACLQLEA